MQNDQETARPAIPTSERLQVAREGAERAVRARNARFEASLEAARDAWRNHVAECPDCRSFDCAESGRLFVDYRIAKQDYSDNYVALEAAPL